MNTAKNLLSQDSKNNILHTEPEEGKSLGIEKIRELKHSLITSSRSSGEVGKVAIIKNADKMTHEAQNSLLKLIEEPVSKTVLILQAEHLGKLLDTVKSRCQIVHILPISRSQAEERAADAASAQKAYLLSLGESELFETLISGGDSTVSAEIDMAKQFLAKSTFDRLCMQKEYANNETLIQLIDGLERIAEAAMHGSSGQKIKRWQHILEELAECKKALEVQTSAKLVFLKLSACT